MRDSFLQCAVALIIVGIPGVSLAGTDAAASGSWNVGLIAVIPFANHTDQGEALIRVTREVQGELERRGISYLSSEDIRPVLRRFRIRTSGQISESGMLAIAQETGADAFLLGSVDIYVTDGVPEVAVSVRVLDAGGRTLFRAASAAATGRDDPRLFDGGRVRGADDVLRTVVGRLFEDLDATPRNASGTPSRSVLIIPFDNSSGYPQAADIISGVFVSRLVSDGYSVIEPGIVREIALRDADLSRGSADHRLLSALSKAFGPCVVVTGTVERFRIASGPSGSELPLVEVSARLIDATSRRLLDGFNVEKEGDDSETIFGRGRCYSVGRLASDALASLVGRLDEEGVRNAVN